VSQTGGELITSISECLQGNGHGSLLSDRHYKLSDKERKPQTDPIRLLSGFHVVRPVKLRLLKPGLRKGDNLRKANRDGLNHFLVANWVLSKSQ
jgi:hypothetical protein